MNGQISHEAAFCNFPSLLLKKKITEHVTCCKSKLIGFEFETQVLIEFCLKPFETVLLFLFKVVLYIKV